jgi:hypothetical protein
MKQPYTNSQPELSVEDEGNMQNRMLRKSLVVGIILLFIGASIVSGIGGNIKIENNDYIGSDANSLDNQLIPSSDDSTMTKETSYDLKTRAFKEEQHIDNISLHISENITFSNNSPKNAHLSIVMTVSSPQLIALYKETFGIPSNLSTVDMEVPEYATRILEIEQDGEKKLMEKTDAVREKFYEGISREQKYLFGFQITAFRSSRIVLMDAQDDLKIFIEADATPNIVISHITASTIVMTMCSPPYEVVNDFVYAQLDITHIMLLSFPDTQQFVKSWDLTIILPEMTKGISVNENHKTIDLGGGSFIQINVSQWSSTGLHVHSRWVVTENTFEGDTVDLNGVYSVDFSLPLESFSDSMIMDQSFHHTDFRDESWNWSMDWELFNFSDQGGSVEYTVIVDLYLTLNGTLHVDLWNHSVWARADIKVGLEVDATIECTFWEYDFEIDFGKFSERIYGWRGGQPFYVVVQIEPEAVVHVAITGKVHLYLNPEANFWIKAGGDLDFQWAWPPVKFTPIFGYGMGGDFDYDFNVTACVEVRPSLGFALSLLVFDIIGPRIQPEVYLDGEICWNPVTNDVYWNAELGFDLYVGVQFTNFLHWNWPDPIVHIPIAEWSSQASPGDTTPPVTSLILWPKVNGYTGRVTRFVFNVTDPGADSSGVSMTKFKILASQHGNTWLVYDYLLNYSLRISDGVPPDVYSSLYDIKYYSIDNAGNEEQCHTMWVNVDLVPPVSYLTIGQPSSGHYISTITPLTLSASDQGVGSWVIYYRFWYNGGWSNWNNSNGSLSVPFTFQFEELGEHRVQWFAVDAVWNAEGNYNSVPHEETFYVYGYESYLMADANGPYYVELGQSVLLDGSGSQPAALITGYRWDWTDDGTWDTGWLSSPTVSHTYGTKGMYVVRLQVKDNKGRYSTTRTTVFVGINWHRNYITASEGWVGPESEIALDSQGYPHLVYPEEAGNKLRHACWNGSSWHFEQLWSFQVGFPSDGPMLDIAIDNNDNLHFVVTSPDLELMYCFWPPEGMGGNWDWFSFYRYFHDNDRYFTGASIALDSNNNPHIAVGCGILYHTETTLRYIRWTGSQWVMETVESSKPVSGVSLALDSNDKPHIAYRLGHWNEVSTFKYAKKTTSTWSIDTIQSVPAKEYTGMDCSLQIDSNNNPHVAYRYENHNPTPAQKYVYYRVKQGGSWSSAYLLESSGSLGPSLYLDQNNYPHVVFTAGFATSILKQSVKMGASWVTEVIDTIPGSMVGGLVLDNNNLPHIAYSEYHWEYYHGIRYATLADDVNSYPMTFPFNDMVFGRESYNGKSHQLITFDATGSFDFDGNITGYRWDFNNDGIWDTDWLSSSIVNHSYNTSGTYKIKVQIIDNLNGTSSAITDVIINNSLPYTPTNPSPFIGTLVNIINTTLSWSGGDPDNEDTISYKIYFGTNTNPPYVTTLTAPATLKTITWNPGTLLYNTTYYWKIIAVDNIGETATGPIWNFKTQLSNNPPFIPSNPFPSNESIVFPFLILSFNCGDPDNSDIVTYDIYFGTTPNPPLADTIGPYLAAQSNVSWNPGVLSGNMTYFWRIVSWDNHGGSASGPVWCFTTENITVTIVQPATFTIHRGKYVSGGLEDLYESDDQYLCVLAGLTMTSDEPPVWLEIETTAPISTPSQLLFTLEAHINSPGVVMQTIKLYNYTAGSFETLDVRFVTTSDQVATIILNDAAVHYIHPTTKQMKAQYMWKPTGPTAVFPWMICIDESTWTVWF